MKLIFVNHLFNTLSGNYSQNHSRISENSYKLTVFNFKSKTDTFYSHLSASIIKTAHNGTEVDSRYFGIYPGSHLTKEEKAQHEEENESQLSPMALDSSDYGTMIKGMISYCRAALNNEVNLLKKEEEERDVGDMSALHKQEITINAAQFEKMTALHKELTEGSRSYSVLTGKFFNLLLPKNRVHCGSVAQELLEIATKGMPTETIAKPTPIEKIVTIWPENVYNRAEEIAKLQKSELPAQSALIKNLSTFPGITRCFGQLFQPAKKPIALLHHASLTPSSHKKTRNVFY